MGRKFDDLSFNEQLESLVVLKDSFGSLFNYCIKMIRQNRREGKPHQESFQYLTVIEALWGVLEPSERIRNSEEKVQKLSMDIKSYVKAWEKFGYQHFKGPVPATLQFNLEHGIDEL